jgi:uncharacterized membrane protein YkoI
LLGCPDDPTDPPHAHRGADAFRSAVAKDGDGGGGGGHGRDDRGGDDNGGDSDHNGGDSDDDDGSSARERVSSGAILPLAAILARIEPEFGARLIDADLKNRRGRVIYELEMLTRNGRVIDLQVDAATARVLDMEVDD